MLNPMRILYVSGSSAGHLAPLVAVERAVRAIDPSAESLFVCSQTEEDASFLQNEGADFRALPLPRRPAYHPLNFLRSFSHAQSIIDTFKPDAVFSKGGIVSIPVCFAAHRKHIPIVLHESDAVMGKANRLVAKWATKICTGFTMQHSANDRRTITTGNPVRPGIADGSKEKGSSITGLRGNKPVLLVMGGSQGAQALNDAVTDAIDDLLEGVQIVHLTGRGKKTPIQREGYWQTEFAQDELPHLYALADLALSRAGAGSIGELAACGIPMILVPIEGLANDHQVYNAKRAQENDACIILLQKDLPQKLAATVSDLIGNTHRIAEIGTHASALHVPDAAGRIGQILAECVAQRAASY